MQTDYTAMRAREVLAEHAAHAVDQAETPAARVTRVQAEVGNRALVTWDAELTDIVIDYTTRRGA
jgi:hypothetical protein